MSILNSTTPLFTVVMAAARDEKLHSNRVALFREVEIPRQGVVSVADALLVTTYQRMTVGEYFRRNGTIEYLRGTLVDLPSILIVGERDGRKAGGHGVAEILSQVQSIAILLVETIAKDEDTLCVADCRSRYC